MLILGLDNRKEAAKITMKSFPKRHLVTSDFKMHRQKSTPWAQPGLSLGFQMKALEGAFRITHPRKRNRGPERMSQEAKQEWNMEPAPSALKFRSQSRRDCHVPYLE